MPASFETCAHFHSFLSTLDHLGETGLAINLAFLNLDRFRYRQLVRKHAQKKLTELDEERSIADGAKTTKWYCEVKYLAGLADNDPLEKHTDQDAHAEKQDERPPDGVWSWVYRSVFEKHRDRFISFSLSAFCLLVIVLGPLQDAELITVFNCYFTDGVIWLLWGMLTASILLPIGFMRLGMGVVHWATQYANTNIAELAKMKKKVVKEATAPAIHRRLPVIPSESTSDFVKFLDQLRPPDKS
jgi:hypothetical protein